MTVVLTIRSSPEAASDTAADVASVTGGDLLAMQWLPWDTRQLSVATGWASLVAAERRKRPSRQAKRHELLPVCCP